MLLVFFSIRLGGWIRFGSRHGVLGMLSPLVLSPASSAKALAAARDEHIESTFSTNGAAVFGTLGPMFRLLTDSVPTTSSYN